KKAEKRRESVDPTYKHERRFLRKLIASSSQVVQSELTTPVFLFRKIHGRLNNVLMFLR
ncbi:hypothetical protein MKW98_003637, partial [Papaver atlanticum]